MQAASVATGGLTLSFALNLVLVLFYWRQCFDTVGWAAGRTSGL